MNLQQFEKRISFIGEQVEKNVDKLVKKVATEVDAAVVLATPVDTGRARSNWVVELNVPFKGEVPPMSAQDALANAIANIGAYENGDVIHITNNLKYIQRLNEGWSAQAPANFVERAVHVGVAAVKGAKVVVR